MVDLQAQTGQYPTLLAAFMRPDRTFRPVDGVAVIEFEVATPIAGTRDADPILDSWPELVLSTAGAPTVTNPWGSWHRQNGTYLYEGFPQAWTFGCRMQQSRHPICALYRPNVPGTPNFSGGPDRLWEINQTGGQVTDQFGGDPAEPGLADAWAVCATSQDPDTTCRNLFRWELSPTRVKLFVKQPGATAWTRYYEAGLVDANLGNILNAPNGFYVFFGDFAYLIENGTILRFHWDRIAINPGGSTTTPPPAIACNPRPNVMVSTTKAGTGVLQVTLTTTGSGNGMREVRFGAATNARIDAGGQTGRAGSFTVPLSAQPRQFSFTVRRAAGGAATTVPLTVVDACGDWRTFVGGGPSAF